MKKKFINKCGTALTNNMREFMIARNISKLFVLVFVQLMALMVLVSTGCSTSIEPLNGNKFSQVLSVCTLGDKIITYIDLQNYNMVGGISSKFPNNFYSTNFCLSTNRDYFIFNGSTGPPLYKNYFVVYDIRSDSIKKIFPIGLDSVSAPQLCAANLISEPYLIYMYAHSHGLFSIDFSTGNTELISPEHRSNLHKSFYRTDDKKWIVINKYQPNNTEIEFYTAENRLQSPAFILNKNDCDSVDITDIDFNEDVSKMYFAFLLSERRAIYKAMYFGSYDLTTRKISPSKVALPWSTPSYSLKYCKKRKEVYLVGESNKIYIVDVSTEPYRIKDTVALANKLPSASSLLLSKDQNKLFVTYYYNNLIAVIDLETKQIVKTIEVNFNPSVMNIISLAVTVQP